tara:strand:- start:406 stop:582 length:177 start_codon:yes stop_codon:yes gene_type:complete
MKKVSRETLVAGLAVFTLCLLLVSALWKANKAEGNLDFKDVIETPMESTDTLSVDTIK